MLIDQHNDVVLNTFVTIHSVLVLCGVVCDFTSVQFTVAISLRIQGHREEQPQKTDIFNAVSCFMCVWRFIIYHVVFFPSICCCSNCYAIIM